MSFDAKLSGDAAALAREHEPMLQRLPATIEAFLLVELQKWSVLFAPEQRYLRALLGHLAKLSRPELLQAMAGIARIEADAGCRTIAQRDPGRFQDEAQALLRKRRLLAAWRKEVDDLFQKIDPALAPLLYPADAPRKLIVMLYGAGIAIQSDRLWSRFRNMGTRLPLRLEGTQEAGAFLRALFGATNGAARPWITAAADSPLDAWVVESHDGLLELFGGIPMAGLSYGRLRAYRDELTRALYAKIQSGVESPQAFAAYARSLKLVADPGALPYSADVLHAFVRDLFLTGNGTLFVNNTFAEWASVQALRRAQPRVLVTRFGVRDRLKPFSSLLLFSQPRSSDRIPIVEDPVGSFVDVEQLSYYIWLNAEKSPAYRKRTLYLLLAEGVDEMLAIRSDVPGAMEGTLPAASLSDVCATMAHWLGVSVDAPSGRPIAALVG